MTITSYNLLSRNGKDHGILVWKNRFFERNITVVGPDLILHHDLRNCEGVMPVIFLKVELNDALELKPESKAIAINVK